MKARVPASRASPQPASVKNGFILRHVCDWGLCSRVVSPPEVEETGGAGGLEITLPGPGATEVGLCVHLSILQPAHGDTCAATTLTYFLLDSKRCGLKRPCSAVLWKYGTRLESLTSPEFSKNWTVSATFVAAKNTNYEAALDLACM